MAQAPDKLISDPQAKTLAETEKDFLSKVFRRTIEGMSNLLDSGKKLPLLMVALFLVASLLVTGIVGYFIRGDIPSSAAEAVQVLPNFPNVTVIEPGDYGVIHDVTIIKTQIKALVSTGKPDQINFCETTYTLMGVEKMEVFKDADEGTKTDSSDVLAKCDSYAQNSGTSHAGHKVTLVVHGLRDPNKSEFRNILCFIPQDGGSATRCGRN